MFLVTPVLRWGWLLGLLLVADRVLASTVDFELPDLKGCVHKLSDYRGKWVVVNYWATWCPPCLEEMPELEMFHNNHKDKDAVVLGVNMEEIGIHALSRFVAEQFISYPILRTMPAPITELGRIPGMPTSYLINPAGMVVARQVGAVSAADLEHFINNYKK